MVNQKKKSFIVFFLFQKTQWELKSSQVRNALDVYVIREKKIRAYEELLWSQNKNEKWKMKKKETIIRRLRQGCMYVFSLFWIM
jgi:hypothetical protein